jgi:hypothetical protein
MKNFALVSALITLLITVISFDGVASETMTVGNYSFTFNMTAPHQIPNSHAVQQGQILVLEGHILINDYSGLGIKTESQSPDYRLLEVLFKDIGAGFIYAKRDSSFHTLYLMEFENETKNENTSTVYIVSTANLSQSADFFRDVKIARIKR